MILRDHGSEPANKEVQIFKQQYDDSFDAIAKPTLGCLTVRLEEQS